MKGFIPILFFSVSIAVSGQNVAIVQHQGVSTVVASGNLLTDAINLASNGDTIYLPGGMVTSPGTINKRLVIFGAGHYPDSSAATEPTTINTTFTLEENADGFRLYGVRVNGSIVFAENKRIDSVVISRCFAYQVFISGTYDTLTNCRGILLFGNAIGELMLSHATNPVIMNNIINSLFASSRNAWVRNNKISTPYNVQYGLFENNTFYTLSWGLEHCTFSNNTLTFTPGPDQNVWINNYFNIDWNNLFVSQTEWFNYSNDYHLKNPAAYPGTDGLQVGIYGGFYPYKDGAMPSNPHIRSKSIPMQANSSGQLNVQVTVAAQNN